MILLWLLVLYAFNSNALESGIELTNIECITHNSSYVDFPYCHIKAVNRTYKYLSLRAHFYQLPITNVEVNFLCLKRANGYKPFLYNTSVNGCSFMRSRKRYPVFNYLYQFFGTYSNLNHSCPYDHDLLVEKLDARLISEKITNTLPFPMGQYCFHTHWLTDGKSRATVRIYATIS